MVLVVLGVVLVVLEVVLVVLEVVLQLLLLQLLLPQLLLLQLRVLLKLPSPLGKVSWLVLALLGSDLDDLWRK